MTEPTLLHKYDIADFTNNNYCILYFQGSGVFDIEGETIVGFPGLKLNMKIGIKPTHISGSDELYLLGDTLPDLRTFSYCGSESNETKDITPYYYGNLGQGTPDLGIDDCSVIECFWLTEDNCELTDELGCPFFI